MHALSGGSTAASNRAVEAHDGGHHAVDLAAFENLLCLLMGLVANRVGVRPSRRNQEVEGLGSGVPKPFDAHTLGHAGTPQNRPTIQTNWA